jgi:hypothetical protein
MIGLWGNVDVLTPAELQCLVTTNNVGDALDYYPVFTSSGMPLQTQPCSWFYFEHFHLKPRPFFQDFVATPWPFIEFPHQDFLPLLKHLKMRIINRRHSRKDESYSVVIEKRIGTARLLSIRRSFLSWPLRP